MLRPESYRIMPAILALAVAGTRFAAGDPPTPEFVTFDVPAEWVTLPTPVPSPQLASLPGYPGDTNRLTLLGVVQRPDPVIHGDGPYPAVLVLHGSGGLWSSDRITNGLASQFEAWAGFLADQGYLGLFIDSYNPRGISAGFANRRPHHDPGVDDSVCSPNYERPKDVVAGLAYLALQPEVDPERIGLLGFSHGAQTGLNAILDPSVDLTPYTVRYINASNQTVDLEVDSPIRIPDPLPFPRVCVFYYPGCSHYGYHGQASSIAAGRYMPDRRTRVLMFHGTLDSLLGVDDPNATPLTGDLYPIRFAESARLQAEAEAVPLPFVHHLIYDQVAHSFDGVASAEPEDWNTPGESADQKAKRLSRDETRKWFALYLKPAVLDRPVSPPLPPLFGVTWPGEPGHRYALDRTADAVASWTLVEDGITGDGGPIERLVPDAAGVYAYYRLRTVADPPPLNAPEHAGFFLGYDAFDYE